MPPLEHLAAFFVAIAIFAYLPGPALLYAAAQTLAGGRRRGLMATLGLHLGCYVHVIAAAFGLSAIFKHVPELYMLVKIGGAVYLVWLGVSLWRAPPRQVDDGPPPQRSAGRAFLNSIVVEILNPKTALFFIAFLPQFAEPAAAFPIWLQLLILGAIGNVVFSSADLVVVLAASTLLRRLKASAPWQRYVRYAGGSILVGLGARLALEPGT